MSHRQYFNLKTETFIPCIWPAPTISSFKYSNESRACASFKLRLRILRNNTFWPMIWATHTQKYAQNKNNNRDYFGYGWDIGAMSWFSLYSKTPMLQDHDTRHMASQHTHTLKWTSLRNGIRLARDRLWNYVLLLLLLLFFSFLYEHKHLREHSTSVLLAHRLHWSRCMGGWILRRWRE